MMSESTTTEEGEGERPIEYWISLAVDPYTSDDRRKQGIAGVCDRVNADLDGPPVAIRLLGHKIQSPDQTEALHALNVCHFLLISSCFQLTDECVRRCGVRFHNEIAKYRFLNHLVKILSPKYSGGETSEEVKQRATVLLYRWQRSLRHLNKLKQVYDMLREQGVIREPSNTDSPPLSLPPPPPRLAAFEDEDKSRLLADLLRSNDPADLQAANRLIKSMVRSVSSSSFVVHLQEEEKMERSRQREEQLERVERDARMLLELLQQPDQSPTLLRARDGICNYRAIQELHKALLAARPALFRYAGEAGDGDEEVLARVLQINDTVNRAIQGFEFSGDLIANVSLLGEPVVDHSLSGDDILLLVPPPLQDNFSSAITTSGGSALDDLTDIFDEARATPRYNLLLLKTLFSQCSTTPTNGVISSTFDVDQIRISCSRASIVLYDSNCLRLLLSFSETSPPDTQAALLSLSSTSPLPISHIRLQLHSQTDGVNVSQLPSNRDSLPAFNPLLPQENLTTILLISTITHVLSQAEIAFQLSFHRQKEELIEGKFCIPL